MMQVTVEFALNTGMQDRFRRALADAHAAIAKYDGFLGEDAFCSLDDEGRFLSLFYFRDRESMQAWREDADHIRLMKLGKEEIFAWYRIRIAEIERQYGPNESQ